MVDRSVIRKERWRRLWGSKWFLVPVVAGVGLVTLAGGPLVWVGYGCLAFAAGRTAWMLTGGRQQLDRDAAAAAIREYGRAHRAELRQMQRLLRQDRDPRTGEMLRQLRDLYDRLAGVSLSEPDGRPWRMDVGQQVSELYESCLSSLRRSYDLWSAAQKMTTDETRTQVLARRDEVLEEVRRSIDHLGRTIDQIQATDLADEVPDESLASLRDELDRGLTVARNTEARIRDLDRQVDLDKGLAAERE